MKGKKRGRGVKSVLMEADRKSARGMGGGGGRERLEPRNNLDVKRTHHELPHVHYIDVNILCIYMLY